MQRLCILLLMSSQCCLAQQDKLLNVLYGKYQVGLSQEKCVYNDSIHLIFTCWYPSQKTGTDSPLFFRDCLLLDGLNDNRGIDSIVNNIICGGNYRIKQDTLQQLLKTATATYKNAPPLRRKFPAIIWSSRHGTEFYQFAMSEYLASHGYIVFTVSRTSPALPFPWQTENISKEDFLNKHLEMLDQQLLFVKKHPLTDISHIAMFTWSYGSPFAILTQQNHKEIDAVFGFSSVDFRQEYFLKDEFNKRLIPENLKVPYFLFYEEQSRLNVGYDSNALHPVHRSISNVMLFPKLWHGNFNYAEGYLPGLLNLPKTHPWSKPGNDAKIGYAAVCRLATIYLKFIFQNRNKAWLNKQIVVLKKSLPHGFIK